MWELVKLSDGKLSLRYGGREVHTFGLSLRSGLASELPKVLDRLMPKGPATETEGCQSTKSH